jgi:uncharacterized protein (TIGR03437 family)
VNFAGLAAARNEDGSGNGLGEGLRPAQRGSVVQLFGSAAGLFVTSLQDEPAVAFTPPAGGPLYMTDTLPEVRIGGAPATVLFSGSAPGDAVCGPYQSRWSNAAP